MTAWTADELDRIGRADELRDRVAAARRHACGRTSRSGPSARATTSTSGPPTAGTTRGSSGRCAPAQGRIQAGGVERDVAFEGPVPTLTTALHAAYHAKYDRYGPSIVGTVVSPEAARSTLRLVPR